VLLPVYAAFAAALLFYLIVPIVGGFRLRSQWRRFRERVAQLSAAPLLRYGDVAAAEREGRAGIGRFRLLGTIEAIEGPDKVWVRGKGVSALVDLTRAPLFVAAPGPAEPGSIERLRWSSVSSLVEGTSVFLAGYASLERGRPVFAEAPGEPLVAVCHDGNEAKLASRLIAAGRARNEYWNYNTIISLALGVAAISGLLLISRTTVFSSLRALIFLAGAIPILPFAPPGLALFFAYRRLWRKALESRSSRDLLRLPLRYSRERRTLEEGEAPPEGSTWLAVRAGPGAAGREDSRLTLFQPSDPEDPYAETFVLRGDPEVLARRVERSAALYVGAAAASFVLAVFLNYALAFAIWRSVL
jgi:hypothetical protein